MANHPRDATLWKLNELSNVDKHRVPLVAVPSLYETGLLTVTVPTGGVNSRTFDDAPVPLMLEQETFLIKVGFDTVPLSTPHLDWEHGIRVAFHDSLGIGPGMPMIDMLEMMEAMVDYILSRAKYIGATAGAS